MDKQNLKKEEEKLNQELDTLKSICFDYKKNKRERDDSRLF